MISAAIRQLAALLNAGSYLRAEIQAREVLAAEPDSGVAWQLLGAALTAQDKDPLQALSAAVRLMPNDAGAHNNLGNLLARSGRLNEAVSCYARAVFLNPRCAETHNNLAHALIDLGHFDQAVESCRRATKLKPGFAEAHDNEGSALRMLGRLHQAQASHQRAIELDPRFAEAHNNLGNAYRSLGELRRALLSYDRALQIDPRFAQAHCNRATVLRLQGHTEQAQASCRVALNIDSQSAAALTVLAEASADWGDFAAAEELFRQAASIEPQSVEAWAGLARSRKMTTADGAWLGHAQQIASAKLAPLKEITLRYAMGKYYDDLGDFDQAYVQFRRANELTKLCRPLHDRQQLTRTVDFLIRQYDTHWLNQFRQNRADSICPVFIVGMLRSGTTLVEQILAAHPAVFGAGELPFWSAALERQHACVADAQGSGLGQLAADYLQLLRDQSNGTPWVVDKMPTNFAFLGMMHAALPHARIIHLQRNPLDTCLSIYFQHFEIAVSYANDLEDLAHCYTEYLRIMDHWRRVLPKSAILEVPYEGLVADQEGWSRRMLEFVGLPWDARCLEFHRAKRTVVTASKWQVRQKISGSSVGRWRNYAKFLGPLLPLVGTQSPEKPD